MHDNPFMLLSHVTYGSVNNILFPFSLFIHNLQLMFKLLKVQNLKDWKIFFKTDLKIISSKPYTKMNRAYNSSII